MRYRITDEEFEEMKVMYKNGSSYKEIAETFGWARKTIENKFLRTGANKLFKGINKVCKGCGEEFLVVDRYNAHKRKFCTDNCKSSYNRKHKGTYEEKCIRCNKLFYTYSKGKKHCSPECYSESRKLESERIEKKRNHNRTITIYKYHCPQCNEKGYSKYKRKYCSKKCGKEANRIKEKERFIRENIRIVECQECGEDFSTHLKSKVRCSTECNRRYANRIGDLYKKKRGKLIASNGEVDEDITIERLIKRDKATCYLCGEKVRTNKHYNHNLYPCIEHVVPVVRGGTHTWDNVKLAHRICNNYKGTQKVVDYLEKTKPPLI